MTGWLLSLVSAFRLLALILVAYYKKQKNLKNILLSVFYIFVCENFDHYFNGWV